MALTLRQAQRHSAHSTVAISPSSIHPPSTHRHPAPRCLNKIGTGKPHIRKPYILRPPLAYGQDGTSGPATSSDTVPSFCVKQEDVRLYNHGGAQQTLAPSVADNYYNFGPYRSTCTKHTITAVFNSHTLRRSLTISTTSTRVLRLRGRCSTDKRSVGR